MSAVFEEVSFIFDSKEKSMTTQFFRNDLYGVFDSSMRSTLLLFTHPQRGDDQIEHAAGSFDHKSCGGVKPSYASSMDTLKKGVQ